MQSNAISHHTSKAADSSPPELLISRSSCRDVVPGPENYFTGTVSVEMLHSPQGIDRASAGLVTFSLGARTAWHIHPLGQTLIVTRGIGRIQRWGGPIQEIREGDVVHIPPYIKHWHGAAADSAMAHIAITELQDGSAADWLEPVTDNQYLLSPEN